MPLTGPRLYAASRAGSSDTSSLMKLGTMGMLKSRNISTVATAASMAVTLSLRVLLCTIIINSSRAVRPVQSLQQLHAAPFTLSLFAPPALHGLALAKARCGFFRIHTGRRTSKSALFHTSRQKKGARAVSLTLVSFIRTIPSALESHQISTCYKQVVAGYTAGGEFHPALKQTFWLSL